MDPSGGTGAEMSTQMHSDRMKKNQGEAIDFMSLYP